MYDLLASLWHIDILDGPFVYSLLRLADGCDKPMRRLALWLDKSTKY